MAARDENAFQLIRSNYNIALSASAFILADALGGRIDLPHRRNACPYQYRTYCMERSIQDASNSRACLRVVAELSSPPSMRATSSILALASSASMRDTVLPLPAAALLTWKCWFAWLATWGKCVTHNTWRSWPSRFSWWLSS